MRNLFLAAILAAGTPALAAAQGGTFETTLGGGATIPLGNSADAFKTGFHGAASIGYRPVNSKVVFGLDAGYHRLEQKNFTDAHANILTAFARANYDMATSTYLIAGIGLVRNENQAVVSGVRFTNTNSDPALTGGVGLRFGKNLFAEGRVMYIFSDVKSTMIPVTLGVRF